MAGVSGDSGRPPAGTIRHSGNAGRPPAGTIEDSSNAGRPPAGTIEDSGNAGRPPAGTIEDSGNVGRPPARTIEDSSNGGRPPARVTEHSDDVGRRPARHMRRPYHSKEGLQTRANRTTGNPDSPPRKDVMHIFFRRGATFLPHHASRGTCDGCKRYARNQIEWMKSNS